MAIKNGKEPMKTKDVNVVQPNLAAKKKTPIAQNGKIPPCLGYALIRIVGQKIGQFMFAILRSKHVLHLRRPHPHGNRCRQRKEGNKSNHKEL